MNQYLWLPFDELDLASKDGRLAAVERFVVAIVAKGVKSGDWSGFEWIAQRLIGKVKDQVEVTLPKPFLVHRRDGSTLELGAKVEKAEGGDS